MTYEAALFLHLVGVVLFFSGMAVEAMGLAAARRRSHADEIVTLLRLARWGAGLVGAGAVVVLVFGLWLVELTRWSLTDAWLRWALVLFAASVVLGAAGGRRLKRARLSAERLAAQACGPDVRAPGADRVADVLNWSAAAAALAVLALMVWKP